MAVKEALVSEPGLSGALLRPAKGVTSQESGE